MKILPPYPGHRRGLDVSRWQGEIDFALLDSIDVFEFVAIRASVGDYYIDPMFRTYYDGFRSVGWAVGAYVVIDPKNSIASQLVKFQQAVGDLKLDFIVLDVEKDWDLAVDLRNRVYWFLRALKGWDIPIIVYTADWFWSGPIGGRVMPKNPPNSSDPKQDEEIVASGWPGWFASYGDNDEDPFDLAGHPIEPRGWNETDNPDAFRGTWKGWRVWQVTSKGVVPGITTNTVDENYMTEELFQLIRPVAPPPPPPPPIHKHRLYEERITDLEEWRANVKKHADSFPT